MSPCELCEAPPQAVWQDAQWRVIRVSDPAFPAFYRVVAQDHVREFTDLSPVAQQRCMAIVATVEAVLRQALRPDKINLASLGNAVPHLHWHVVARFTWDSHFPGAIWAPALRASPAEPQARLQAALPAVDAQLAARLQAL